VAQRFTAAFKCGKSDWVAQRFTAAIKCGKSDFGWRSGLPLRSNAARVILGGAAVYRCVQMRQK